MWGMMCQHFGGRYWVRPRDDHEGSTDGGRTIAKLGYIYVTRARVARGAGDVFRRCPRGARPAGEDAPAEVLLRRPRLEALRGHLPAARVLPDARRARDLRAPRS